MTRCWRVDERCQTLVLASEGDGLPEVIYWGASLPEGEDLVMLAAAHRADVSGGMLDRPAPLTICPLESDNFPGQPGLILATAKGALIRPVFSFESADDEDGLTLRYRDGAHGLNYSARIIPDFVTHLLTLSAVLEADAPIRLHWLAAPVLPAPHQALEMIGFSGRWCGEFQLVHTPFTPGIHMRESRSGRSGPEHFPGLIIAEHGATNTGGAAVAFHYGWSGGHRMIAEELPDGRRQIQFGHAVNSELAPGTHFESAPLYATWSGTGINGCAVAFQRHARDRIVQWPHPGNARPVNYNCWEAVYFDHDPATLKDIATRAAAIGAERFVLDDGWFGHRDDDTSSLGDWQIDRRKWPDGLTPFITFVKNLGMSFGLWIEPEMVNRDSNLFRAHPVWVLGPADQTTGRHQMALDMSRPDVRAYLFESLAALLSIHDIDYVKWDHNRPLPYSDAAQTRGTYALFDRLRAAFPRIEWESCASGGGRIDFGIMERCQRVWLSDSNDALERLRIQHDAALFLPGAVTGSHVGPRQCHTSGRTLDIELRAWSAAQRHMGLEMDPRELSENEHKVLSDVIAWWKANRDWLMCADILRLDSADPAIIAEQQLASDGSRFVVFAAQSATSAQITPRPLRLTGLDPAAYYEITLKNGTVAPVVSRGAPALKHQMIRLSGQALMGYGLTLPCSLPAHIRVIEGVRSS